MPISQEDLARQFALGADPKSIPTASNLKAVPADDSSTNAQAWIVGYGWAIYAVRRRDGTLVLCEGWDGYSASTSRQLTMIRSGFKKALYGRSAWDDVSVYDHARFVAVDSQPQTSAPPSTTDLLGEQSESA